MGGDKTYQVVEQENEKGNKIKEKLKQTNKIYNNLSLRLESMNDLESKAFVLSRFPPSEWGSSAPVVRLWKGKCTNGKLLREYKITCFSSSRRQNQKGGVGEQTGTPESFSQDGRLYRFLLTGFFKRLLLKGGWALNPSKSFGYKCCPLFFFSQG